MRPMAGRRGAARVRRGLALASVIAVATLGFLRPASATTHRTWVVRPGQSIQAAVDKAASGDTISIRAGTYREAVCVDGKGLTVVGAGPASTTIEYPAWQTVADLPAVGPVPCWVAHQKSDAENDRTTLADDVSGLFFLDPDSPVRVSGLTTRNHPADGITVWGAHGVDVHSTRGVAHERYGIAVAASTRIAVSGNVEEGLTRPAPVYAGTGGITVADTARADALVVGNAVKGYNLGIFVRESRTGALVANRLSGNCLGILVFDDSAREIPDTANHFEGGNWKVLRNVSTANNRYCIAGRDGSQRTSGVGVAVVNADKVLVDGNRITGNVPTVPAGQEPLNFPSGGVVLLGFAPPPGTSPPGAVDPGAVENVKVIGNVVTDNPAGDINVVQPTPFNPLVLPPGPGIVVRDNTTS